MGATRGFLASLAVRVSLAYLVLSLTWIWTSDTLVTSRGWPSAQVQNAQTHKGWAFVVATSLLLYITLQYWESRLAREARERLAAQEALRESETRLRQMASSIQEVFWLTAPDKNTILFVSPAYESIWGRSCQSLLENPHAWLEAIHEEDQPMVLAALPRQLTGGYDLTYRIQTPTGEVRWIRDRAFPVVDETGKPYRVAGVACDVTAQHGAAEALRESEERYRCLVDLTPEGIFIQSGGLCVFANPAFQKMVGEDPTGRCVLDYIHPDSRAAAAERIRRLNELREPQLEPTPRTFLRSDGAQVDAETLAVPYTHQGQTGALVIVRDVAERQKRLELESQLRQAQKMEAVGQLAGGIAHDFNNLLTVIMGNLELLESHGEEDAALIAEIGGAANRAAQLTHQLLTFSRKQVLRPQPLDLNEAVSNITRMLRRVLGEHVTLTTQLGTDLPSILADPGMVEQVVLNLAVNARDAMPQGGELFLLTSRASAAAMAGCATLSGQPADCVCLEVRDTGLGMDSQTMGRMFEPFFTTKDVGQGTGLGLATVYGIVEQHHGALRVDSEPGQGTRFRVYWPLGQAVPSANPTDAPPSDHEPAHETVLVAEDDSALRGLLHRILDRQGYRVLMAASGPEALGLWNAHKAEIKLLVTDLVMPGGLGGLELGRRLQGEKPSLKVLYSSGYSDTLAGAPDSLGPREHFLPKPYAPDELSRAVRNCLKG